MSSSMKQILVSILCLFSSDYACAWQSKVIANPAVGQVFAVWTSSSSDTSVSLTVACIYGQSNATVSISTDNHVVGTANSYEHLAFDVGVGALQNKGSGPSFINARIREDGMGMYLGEGSQGLGMKSMIANNDWMKVYWSFATPSRGKWISNIIGQPSAKPQKQYSFDLRGFNDAIRLAAPYCGW